MHCRVAYDDHLKDFFWVDGRLGTAFLNERIGCVNDFTLKLVEFLMSLGNIRDSGYYVSSVVDLWVCR